MEFCCFCFALGQEKKEGSLQPPCPRPPGLTHCPVAGLLLGAVGNVIIEILQINIDGPATGMLPVIKARLKALPAL